ncbi:2-hydroxychromene-2-carboxylate isomerase [Magnetospirillum sp. ME-1]|uniref:2-hydroxychromene-2-carboxylate isomerase n=1 Tax=Magnetospirillum sp. ME-1 TaxID=1639348 RepID=UPI000A17B4EF|nr:2-hydroxychromene-2-carboxylate isomerase [Magnetospirillum sp. ME-1]ARJ67007.1 2-hydroxychromene-2-carboxylate isomerase [Magnetospirillum sp. ME-1]
MAAPVEFYFDFASPYGFFAAQEVDGLVAPFGREVAWKPIMIGSAFKASGNLPLVSQPLKGEYSRHDWERLARLMDVPYRLPDPFPVPALPPSRAYWWLESKDKDLAKSYARAVYLAYFAENMNISSLEVACALGVPLGIDPDEMAAAAQAPEWKARLKDETEAAIAKGVFGSPFFLVDGEGFWGADRLWMVRAWLEKGGW